MTYDLLKDRDPDPFLANAVNEFNEKNMDLHNNSVGYYLGNQAIKNNWSEEELLKTVIKAADDGKLYGWVCL